MKSIRDLQKKSVSLTGIVPSTVDDSSDTQIHENIEPQPAKPTSRSEVPEMIEIANQMEKVDNNVLPYVSSEDNINDSKRKVSKENGTSIPFIKKDVLQLLLSKERQYNNSNKPIVIDSELKSNLEILSAVSTVPISTIVNNLLYMMFTNTSDYNLNFEVTEYMIRRQKENINKFK